MLNFSMKKMVSLGALALLGTALSLAAQTVDPAADEPAAVKPLAKPKMPAEVVYESSVGEVRFPHRAHVKMKCPTCHHQIHAAELNTPHDEYLDSAWINCQTCHSETSEFSGKYYKCSHCHHAAPQNISDETLSSKVVTHESCWQCHDTGTGVAASESCGKCHLRGEAVPADASPTP
jgi:hypothetical protein